MTLESRSQFTATLAQYLTSPSASISVSDVTTVFEALANNVAGWAAEGEKAVFTTVAALQADTTRTASLSAGDKVRILDHGGFNLVVVSSSAHLTSGAGTLFQVSMPTARPEYFGAPGDGSADDTAVFNTLIGWVNGSGPAGIELKGQYKAANLDAITRNDAQIIGWGAKVTKNGNGVLFDLDGLGNTIVGLEINGASYTNSCINMGANRQQILFCHVHDSGGKGIALAENIDEAIVMGCRVHDCSSGGISAGKANYPRVLFNSVYNIGPEGIPVDEAYYGLIMGNIVHDTGGVGTLGCSGGEKTTWAFNVGYDSNGGMTMGGHKTKLIQSLVIGNYFHNNDKYGIRWRNDYRECPVTGITQASPGVVTFASISISNISTATPPVVTAASHGKVTGDRITIHNVTGNATLTDAVNDDPSAGNSARIMFRIKVIDANSFTLHDQDTMEDIDGSGFSYTSGGTVDHAHEVDQGWLTFESVGGMTELNGTSGDWPYRFSAVTATTGTLSDIDGNDLDTSGYTAYTSGGMAFNGGWVERSVAAFNVLTGNTEAQMLVDDPRSGATAWSGATNNILLANQVNPANQFTGYDPTQTDSARPVFFHAKLGSTASNVTGNNTTYQVICDTEVYDTSGSHNASNGKFTADRAGVYRFSGGVEITGMNAGTVTAATLTLLIEDAAGTTVATFVNNLVPPNGDATATTWKGEITREFYLADASTAKLKVTVNGLGGDTADLVAGNDTFFSGRAVA